MPDDAVPLTAEDQFRFAAADVAAHLQADDQAAKLDPAMIALLIELLKALLPLIVDQCDIKPEHVPRVATECLNKPVDRMIIRRALRLMIRRELGGDNFSALGRDRIVTAVLDVASNKKSGEMPKLLAACWD